MPTESGPTAAVSGGGGRREFLVVANTERDLVADALAKIRRHCDAAGIRVRAVDNRGDHLPAGTECEVVIVLGGDGTFLRAAELAYPNSIPLLGINLGHIGFLAEVEAGAVDEVMPRLISGDYQVVDRMTLDIEIIDPARPDEPQHSWAINEVAIQNVTYQGVLEVVTEVDGRPVSAFGADGILVATPTGSTAYAFSAGGPVMWPELDAILIVPSNAHALFARPMVTSPRSRVAVEIDRNGRDGMAFCDGRRRIEVPAGGRVEVVCGSKPLKWVRLDSNPFADRLVTKFELPVTGWRGRD